VKSKFHLSSGKMSIAGAGAVGHVPPPLTSRMLAVPVRFSTARVRPVVRSGVRLDRREGRQHPGAAGDRSVPRNPPTLRIENEARTRNRDLVRPQVHALRSERSDHRDRACRIRDDLDHGVRDRVEDDRRADREGDVDAVVVGDLHGVADDDDTRRSAGDRDDAHSDPLRPKADELARGGVDPPVARPQRPDRLAHDLLVPRRGSAGRELAVLDPNVQKCAHRRSPTRP
jgi:hypothetical protein